jgi:hypothetical protein
MVKIDIYSTLCFLQSRGFFGVEARVFTREFADLRLGTAATTPKRKAFSDFASAPPVRKLQLK